MAEGNTGPLTIGELAGKVGVSRQTLYSWEKTGCPIREGEAAVREWMRVNKPAESANIHQRLLESKLAKTAAEAERVELENAVTKGRYVERDAVERFLTQFVASVRAQVESWPELVILEIPGEYRVSVYGILTEQVRMLLTQLADMPGDCWADEAVKGDALLPVETPDPNSTGT